LKEAQARVLNFQYWHDFFKAVAAAGFPGGRLISSNNSLLFTYALYLLGRTEYHVDEHILRKAIARWFFMSSLTGRYTTSPESKLEFDLARFRDVKDAAGFVRVLDAVCEGELTGDFWSIALPNDLATSSPRSPSLFAYYAALVLLDAKPLFSDQKILAMLDPSVHASRAAVERHHLFPKAHLKKLGIVDTRDTNQIANYALLEWGDNGDISGSPPAEYLPVMRGRVTGRDLERMTIGMLSRMPGKIWTIRLSSPSDAIELHESSRTATGAFQLIKPWSRNQSDWTSRHSLPPGKEPQRSSKQRSGSISIHTSRIHEWNLGA
jgi:hypothetical protein